MKNIYSSVLDSAIYGKPRGEAMAGKYNLRVHFNTKAKLRSKESGKAQNSRLVTVNVSRNA
jgi:hypothetical protein